MGTARLGAIPPPDARGAGCLRHCFGRSGRPEGLRSAGTDASSESSLNPPRRTTSLRQADRGLESRRAACRWCSPDAVFNRLDEGGPPSGRESRLKLRDKTSHPVSTQASHQPWLPIKGPRNRSIRLDLPLKRIRLLRRLRSLPPSAAADRTHMSPIRPSQPALQRAQRQRFPAAPFRGCEIGRPLARPGSFRSTGCHRLEFPHSRQHPISRSRLSCSLLCSFPLPSLVAPAALHAMWHRRRGRLRSGALVT